LEHTSNAFLGALNILLELYSSKILLAFEVIEILGCAVVFGHVPNPLVDMKWHILHGEN
jgi:hypothetical protein